MPTPQTRPRGHGQWVIHKDTDHGCHGIVWRTDDGTVGFLPVPGGDCPEVIDWDTMSAGQRVFVGELSKWREDNPR